MNDSKAYAPLGMLRDAIRDHKVISFSAGGERLTIEPHEMGQAKKTGAMTVIGRIVSGPLVGEWREFRYYDLRGLQIEREVFEPHHRPYAIRAHRTPAAVERSKRLAAAKERRASQLRRAEPT